MFKALVLNQLDGKTQAAVKELEESDLPEGEVTVKVSYSSLNYKDGLAVTGTGKIINEFPMVPGIDFAGIVKDSSSELYKTGDQVILTGWGVGERHWGGFSEVARVKADWLVPLPEGMTASTSMIIGTAGLTAMLCVMGLEEGGVTPDKGKIIVTGASGGVGSVAVALLSGKGYDVTAVTGRASSGDYLKELGANDIVTREEMSEKSRPLERQRWAGAVDTVGDTILARVLAETQYGGTVTACGLAASFKLPTTVMPFILRNIRLQGVDSVQCPAEKRKIAWQRLQQEMPEAILNQVGSTITLDQIPEYSEKIINGQVRGRTIIEINKDA